MCSAESASRNGRPNWDAPVSYTHLHDLDLIRNADYVIDMGPGGGDAGGQIVCAGTPGDIAACSKSITGRYL